ncbi:MAG: hypothetical protein U0794_22365 [Isosphaeraceae bacterium]
MTRERPQGGPGQGIDEYVAGDPVMAGLVSRVISRLEAGERVVPEEYTESHPEHVALLRRLLPVLVAMAELGRLTPRLETRSEPLAP